ncbi:MAG: methyltransferase [Egibacteraceae bacterium]
MSDDQPDLMTLSDLTTPWAIRVAATLRIADLLAEGVTELDELAGKAAVDARALGRVLRYLTCRGIFSEPERGRFALTDAALPLQDSHPGGLRAWFDIEGAGGRMDKATSSMLEAVRTGEPSYSLVHGRGIWDDFAADPGVAASFDRLMVIKSSWLIADVVNGYDWPSVGHVVDVGGGAGLLLTEILRAHEGVRGTIVEQAPTVTRARDAIATAGLADRCEAVVGSFFDPLPTVGDLYVLWNVLHDWTDAEAAAILRRCAEAAGDAGRVLIVEFGEQDPHSFTSMDLLMLVVNSGHERTVEEFTALAASAGLTMASATPTPSGLSLIELTKARSTSLASSKTGTIGP